MSDTTVTPRSQTWAEWSRAHPGTLTVRPLRYPTGKHLQVYSTDSALWHLSDYAVSSKSGDTVYLVPRKAVAP